MFHSFLIFSPIVVLRWLSRRLYAPVLDCLRQNKTDMALILLNNPAVDLDTVDRDGSHLERLAREFSNIRTEHRDITASFLRNMTEIQDLLWTFRSVQQRMILRDSLLTRQAGSVSSLQSLSRDAVLLILSTNNSQERLVTPLVDRLEGEITVKARELLAVYQLA